MKKLKQHRLLCVYKGCNHYTRVVLMNESMGYYFNKKYGLFDTRNIGFVCPQHQEAYNRHHKRTGDLKIYGKLDRGKALI